MAYFFLTLNTLLLLAIIARALQRGHLAAYPLFFSYIAYCLAIGLIQLATVVSGFDATSSPEYRVVYHLTNFPIPLFQLVILGWVYSLLVDRTYWWKITTGIVLAGAVSAPVVWTFGQMEAGFFYTMQASFSAVLLVTCILVFQVLINKSEIDIGRNARGMLYGIGVVAVVQSHSFLSVFIGSIGYELFRILIPLCYTLSFLIFSYALWDHHPPFKHPEGELRVAVQGRLRQLARSAMTIMFR